MKKACDICDNLSNRHPELTRKQRKRSFLYSVSVSGSKEIPKRVRNDAIKAFTLAEIMIVLSVIAVLTAILLPAARNATPNEDILKFKKAHNTFQSAISELVNSDEYYLDGDLSKKPDGSLVESQTYFCETLSDVLNAKSTNCASGEVPVTWQFWQVDDNYSLEQNKEKSDVGCATIANYISPEITLQDGTIIYQTYPPHTFGASHFKLKYQGFMFIYKTYCIDIDGINNGEAPFGYGVRVDGKILSGARADEWLSKSIQEKD